VPREKLSQERIAELDKFAVSKNYEFIWWAMFSGFMNIDPSFRTKRMVRVKKS
jgi:hypothetical protein